MQTGRIAHVKPYGTQATLPVGMSGIMDDVQAKLAELMTSPDAFKYGMYAVGAVFLLFALSSGASRGRR